MEEELIENIELIEYTDESINDDLPCEELVEEVEC